MTPEYTQMDSTDAFLFQVEVASRVIRHEPIIAATETKETFYGKLLAFAEAAIATGRADWNSGVQRAALLLFGEQGGVQGALEACDAQADRDTDAGREAATILSALL